MPKNETQKVEEVFHITNWQEFCAALIKCSNLPREKHAEEKQSGPVGTCIYTRIGKIVHLEITMDLTNV